MGERGGEQVRPISTTTVHSAAPAPDPYHIHLNPWDLSFLSIPYHQKGLLFPITIPHPTITIPLLRSSLSTALAHFHPLAGRLFTTTHTQTTTSVSILCNNAGALFLHAIASHLSVSDILAPIFKPQVVGHSFFPLNDAVGHDGHHLPLLAVQATELKDGVFLAVSVNHVAADGTALWHFINSWAEIARKEGGGAETTTLSLPPVLERWLPEPLRPHPLRLPFPGDTRGFIRRYAADPDLKEATFRFSPAAVAGLRAEASLKQGISGDEISALEALLGHFWRCATRARRLPAGDTTRYVIVVDCRHRIRPPLEPGYFGNAVQTPVAEAKAEELLDRGDGFAAAAIHRAIAGATDTSARAWMQGWIREPAFKYVGGFGPAGLFTASSPGFDVYKGCDFGWGRPVAVRSGGWGGRFDGRTAVFPTAEEGGVELEVCLKPEVLAALMDDGEFVGLAVGSATPVELH